MNRASGILLPVFSLPSPYGIGCFSKEAYQWIDFLAEAGMEYWQILPLGPTSYGDSPYQSFSTYAGNPYFIDPDKLIQERYLTRAQLEEVDKAANPHDIDYGKIYTDRMLLLRKAYAESKKRNDPDFEFFQRENAWWLNDYALFMAVKDAFAGAAWNEWSEDIRYRRQAAMEYYQSTYSDEINFYQWLQYLFAKQWRSLKAYANEKGIKIIGDIPIYVAFDSADVWANPSLFQLDEKRNPKAVAGCPPDGFTADGQLWGNPLYNWELHKQTNYDWWVSRMAYCFELYDVVRIDHFRGFDEYFSIPASDSNAKNGHWEKGPGIDLFKTITERLGKKEIIAEDLGYITDSVRELVKATGYPNMKVLQFAFDSRDSSGAEDYLPHNYPKNCVCYTGTHDNETIYGWLSSIQKIERDMVCTYLNRQDAADTELAHELVRTAVASVANLCIIPLQDYLVLDNSARINFPSSMGKNWRWRMSAEDMSSELAGRIRMLNQVYGRVNDK